MKRISITLPHVKVEFTDMIEPGSLRALSELPNGQIVATSATTGRRLTLNVFVAPGEHPVTELNRDFVVSEILDQFILAVRKVDLFDDGFGLLDVSTKERTSGLNDSVIPITDDDNINFVERHYRQPQLQLWRNTGGKRIADRILQSLKDRARPMHADHVQFSLENNMQNGDVVGMLCFAGPNQSRIRGLLYMGTVNQEDLAIKREADVSILNRLVKTNLGVDPVLIAVTRNGRVFTASLNVPFENCESWFVEGALRLQVINSLIKSVEDVVEMFG